MISQTKNIRCHHSRGNGYFFHNVAFPLIKCNELRGSELSFDLFKALRANLFLVEENDVFRTSAEYAGGLIFAKDDHILVHKDFQGSLYLDVESLSDLYRNNYSSELINFAYHST